MAQLSNTSHEDLASDVGSSYLDLALDQVQTLSFTQLASLVVIAWFLARNFLPSADGIKAPSVGYRSVFEPSILVRLRFALGALDQVNEGYIKVLSLL